MPSTPRIAPLGALLLVLIVGLAACSGDDDGGRRRLGPRGDLVDRAAGGPRRAGAVAAGHRGGRHRRDRQQLRGHRVPAGASGRGSVTILLHVTGEGTRANGVPFSVEVVRTDHRGGRRDLHRPDHLLGHRPDPAGAAVRDRAARSPTSGTPEPAGRSSGCAPTASRPPASAGRRAPRPRRARAWSAWPSTRPVGDQETS